MQSTLRRSCIPGPSHMAGMAGEYLGEAYSVAAGHGILVPDDHYPQDTSLLAHAPGYGIFLAAIYSLFGGSYFTVQLVQNLINSISPVLLFLIAGHLITWKVGFIAGLLAAVSHHFGYYSNWVLPDSVCALPILAAVYLIVRNKRARPPVALYIAAGLLVGLSIWLRPNALLMGPFFAVFLWLNSVHRAHLIRRTWIIAVVSLIVIAPVTIRNYLIYGKFVPISANAGQLLWLGIGEAGGERLEDIQTM